MARLLKVMPELLILIKGIGVASRSVLVFFVLWLVIIYVFAIIFRQITDGNEIGEKYFGNVAESMNTLLLDGVFPDHSPLVNAIGQDTPVCWPILMFFVMLAGITMMYMLVGVLVDIVSVIAAAEKEGMAVSSLASQMRDAFARMDRSTEDAITKYEFQQLLLDPEISEIITDAGVDVVPLMDMCDLFFFDLQIAELGLSFEEFLEIILAMRGSQPARVKDIKSQISIIKKFVTESTDTVVKKLSAEIGEISKQVLELRSLEFQSDLDEAEVIGDDPAFDLPGQMRTDALKVPQGGSSHSVTSVGSGSSPILRLVVPGSVGT
jgi:hypothetical protein